MYTIFVMLYIYMCSKKLNIQESYLIQLLLLVHHLKCYSCNELVVYAGSVK